MLWKPDINNFEWIGITAYLAVPLLGHAPAGGFLPHNAWFEFHGGKVNINKMLLSHFPQESAEGSTNKLYDIPACVHGWGMNQTRERVKGNEFLLRSQYVGNKGNLKALSYAGS